MCQPKSKGGERCFIHKIGTKAAIAMTSVTSRVPKRIIEDSARELNKEGRKLPTPAPEDVIGFTRTRKFEARHSPDVPETHRDKLESQWDAAASEKVNGGTFHAWRNIGTRSIANWRRSVTASVIAVPMVISGCGISGPQQPEVTPTPSASVSTQAPDAFQIQREDSIKNLESQGVILNGETIEGPDGSFPAITITADSGLADSPVIAEADLPAGWTQEDAYQAAVQGMDHQFNRSINHGWDSGSKPSAQEYEAWKAKHAHTVSDQMADQYNSSTNYQDMIVPATWTQSEEMLETGYHYVADGKTPKFSSIEFEVTRAEPWSGGMYYEITSDVVMNAQTADGKPVKEENEIKSEITMVKENGEYKTAGFKDQRRITEAESIRITDLATGK